MKKIANVFIVFLITMILSGCTATYDLEIKDDGTLLEQLKVNNQLPNDVVELYTKNPIPLSLNEGSVLDYDGDITSAKTKEKSYIEYYDVKYNNETMTFKGKNNIKKFDNTRIATSLFNNIHSNYYSNLISIYGYNGLMVFLSYPELERVVVNIKTDLKVVDNNADSVDGNKYTWIFDKNTPDTKTLYLEIERIIPKEVKEKSDEGNSGGKYTVYIVFGLIGALLILALILKRHYSKNKTI